MRHLPSVEKLVKESLGIEGTDALGEEELVRKQLPVICEVKIRTEEVRRAPIQVVLWPKWFSWGWLEEDKIHRFTRSINCAAA